MNVAQFVIIGGLAGILMVMTSGWLITGYIFHRYQKRTPSTWRPENWRQHALAVLWAAIGGGGLGAVEAQVAWSADSVASAVGFAFLAWAALAGPVIATMATYVNWHRAVVTGLLMEWLLFAIGVSLACRWFAN